MSEDIVVINNVLQGKIDHFGSLMTKYHNEMFSFVFNMLGNYDDTEDLIQEIFIKVYNNLNRYNSRKSSFRTWLYRIASNHTINYLKSSSYKRKSGNELDTTFIEDDLDIEAEIVKEQQIKEIIKVMKMRLSEKHQKILILHYFSGLSVKEIGLTLEIPEKTIYKALKTSVEKIKEEVTTND
ncbi:ECF RNA polymerase sigma factor SigW [Candidatus Izimaplasma bacterium HR1]|uniref:RNA polymerase sigma factor n=1 Tax=Candidatus Izimoplasma sp. HR1 TaxID=1541959 RepID=UPI0004F86082|nr:ECF RNA polymerase sigma factor SigW [Candidatus Izimaplasma bacterium HR1]